MVQFLRYVVHMWWSESIIITTNHKINRPANDEQLFCYWLKQYFFFLTCIKKWSNFLGSTYLEMVVGLSGMMTGVPLDFFSAGMQC